MYVWLSHIEKLLLTLGWWIVLGLILCALAHWLLPASAFQPKKSALAVPMAMLIGCIFPICNCGIAPFALSFCRRGGSIKAAGAFFLTATLVNPAAMLVSYALLGPQFTCIYLITGLLCAGITASFLRESEETGVGDGPESYGFSESFRWNFFSLGPELAQRILAGILIEALVLTVLPAALFQGLFASPADASPFHMAVLGFSEYLCIPDDIPLAATLSASGAPLSGTLLFLLIGILSNIPEAAVILGMPGKGNGLRLVLIPVIVSAAAGGFICLFMDKGFMPLMDLSFSDSYIQAARLMTVGTWKPARLFSGVLLLFMGVWGIRKKLMPE